MNQPSYFSKLIFDYHLNLIYLFLLFSDIYPFLEKMCLGGTRRQAKFAVSAIASLSSEHSVFSKLFEVHFLGGCYLQHFNLSFSGGKHLLCCMPNQNTILSFLFIIYLFNHKADIDCYRHHQIVLTCSIEGVYTR